MGSANNELDQLRYLRSVKLSHILRHVSLVRAMLGKMRKIYPYKLTFYSQIEAEEQKARKKTGD